MADLLCDDCRCRLVEEGSGYNYEDENGTIRYLCRQCGEDRLAREDYPGTADRAEECSCGGEYEFNRYCGCLVCSDCDDHRGMCRCYCGWAASGGDGYQELIDEGETIEPEDY